MNKATILLGLLELITYGYLWWSLTKKTKTPHEQLYWILWDY